MTDHSIALVIPLNLLRRLVGAAAGIALDPEAVEMARAEIASVEALAADRRERTCLS